jgi:hypothetical protein
MELADLLKPEAIRVSSIVKSKKRLFQDLAELVAKVHGIPADEAVDALQERESLGPTGVGHGVALPHARLDGLDRVVGCLRPAGKADGLRLGRPRAGRSGLRPLRPPRRRGRASQGAGAGLAPAARRDSAPSCAPTTTPTRSTRSSPPAPTPRPPEPRANLRGARCPNGGASGGALRDRPPRGFARQAHAAGRPSRASERHRRPERHRSPVCGWVSRSSSACSISRGQSAAAPRHKAVAQDRMPQRLHVHPQLVAAPGLRRQPHPRIRPSRRSTRQSVCAGRPVSWQTFCRGRFGQSTISGRSTRPFASAGTPATSAT